MNKHVPTSNPSIFWMTGGIITAITATSFLFFRWPLAAMLSTLILVLGVIGSHAFKHSPDGDVGSREPLRYIVFGGSALLSLVLTIVIPPMQVPDENAHLIRAAGLADGQVMLKKHSKESPGTQTVDTALIEYSSRWLKVADRTVDHASRDMYDITSAMHWSGHHVKTFTSAAPYYPMLYAPAAAGLAAGKAFDQPVGISIAWARIAMWASGMLVLFITLRIAQAGMHTICAAAVLPMTLQQAASINLDAITIPTAFLVVAMISRGWFCATSGQQHPMQYAARAAAWAIFAMLCLAKPVFLTLLAPISWQALAKRQYSIALPIIATVATVIAWQAHVTGHFVDTRITLASPPTRIASLFADPMPFLQLVTRSFEAYGEFYVESMIGRLGWLDVHLPSGTITIGIALLMSAVVADALSQNTLPAATRAMFLLAAAAYCAGTIVLLWAAWTPPGSLLLFGVQGRYFIPMLPVIAILLGTRNGTDRPARIASRVFIGVFLIHLAALCIDLPNAMIQRYWL